MDGIFYLQTYKKALHEAKSYHGSLGVLFGHWQFDSRFYPK
jgi:hypothetical protein